jgi:hypothetical protein
VSRLVALIVLTAAFAPAAVMGALPVVAPVLIVLAGVAMAITAFDAGPTPEAMLAEAASEPAQQP